MDPWDVPVDSGTRGIHQLGRGLTSEAPNPRGTRQCGKWEIYPLVIRYRPYCPVWYIELLLLYSFYRSKEEGVEHDIGVAQNDGSEPAEMTWLWPRPVGSAAGVAGAVGPGGSAPQTPAARQRHPENVETNGSGNLVLMGRC